MKVFLGIAAAALLALGVWLSLTLGDPVSRAVPPGPPGWQTYLNPHYSITYPPDYLADATYVYQGLGPAREISGARFVIPASLADGTNLSPDSYLSVEPMPGAINSCSAEIYLGDATSAGFVDEGGRRYSIASSTGAAAGNRYEETVYATPVSGGCLAVRYFIHYGAIQNYPEGSVREFDRQALLAQFDAMRRSLVIKE